MANLFQNFVNSLQKKPKVGLGTAVSNAVSSFSNKPAIPVSNSQNAGALTVNQFANTKPVPQAAPKSVVAANNSATSPIVSKPVLPAAGQQYVGSLLPESAPKSNPAAGVLSPGNTGSQAALPEAPKGPSATDTAFAEYIKFLTPSAKVTGAQSAYNTAVADQSKAYAGFEGQGRGIPLGLIRGQQEKYLRQTQPELARLQGEIGIAQDEQLGQRDVAKAGLDFALEKDRIVRDAEKLAYDREMETKKFNEDIRQFGISQANELQKARIAHSGSGGGGGPSNKLLSVAEAKSLGVPYGTTEAQAAAMNKRPLTTAQQTAQTNANSALLSLSNLTNAIKNPDGTYKNMKLVTFGLGKVAYAQRELKDVISRIRTGAALTTNEEKFYEKQVPNKYDTDATAQAKINQLAAFYSGIAGNPVTLELSDGTVVVADDMFDESTRTEVRQAIAAGANIIAY